LLAQDERRLPVAAAVRVLFGARHEPLALLAGRLRQQLLGPEPEAAGVRVDAHLVARMGPVVAEREAELEPRVVVVRGAARLGGLAGGVEQAADVDSLERRGHEPERRARRVAAADLGVPGEDRA